jgi:hypothetical protein
MSKQLPFAETFDDSYPSKATGGPGLPARRPEPLCEDQ